MPQRANKKKPTAPESVPGYRRRFYATYNSRFKHANPRFDEAAARRVSRAFAFRFRGWLPQAKDAPIVDLACGNGILLHFFREKGYTQICGVEISREQAELAAQVTPHVQLIDAVEFLAKHPGAFDLITAFDLVEHLTKNETFGFLEACQSALRPGGRLILQTPNGVSPWGPSTFHGDFTHEVCFTPGLLSELLRACGFDSPKAREVGPVPYGGGVICSLRYVLWRVLRLALRAWNLIETGSGTHRILTRVFLISATKR